MTSILKEVNEPKDLKELSIDELNHLAGEIRNTLIENVTMMGGHMGSNLGMVETTIAMHYVFDSPKDKFVFDVSHQSYTHKILTGRKEGFINKEKHRSLSGFTTPSESEHDIFKIGHTSTSVSLATGLAKARDLKGGNENVIAVIGDGSMSGGEAFEGLNNASVLNSNFIILFNDNEMSIAPNQGGMYSNFKELRDSKGTCENNFFKTFGLDYYYIEEGNDIESLIAIFSKVKDSTKPTVIHLHTLKGKGLKWAMDNKEAGHWMMPASFDSEAMMKMPTYEKITSQFLLEKIKKDKTIAVLSAGTPGATGLTIDFREQAGNQYIDVGVAEEHAVAMISGMARNGAKPVYEIASSFSQRTYDQLNHDLAMNNAPATILVFGGSIGGGDCTHLGMFDMSLMSNIPNLVCLAPTTKEEYLAMLDWSIEQTSHPVIIRVPKKVVSTGKEVSFSQENCMKAVMEKQGNQVALLGLGNFMALAKEVSELLESKTINATIINPVNYSMIDKDMLHQLKENHNLVVTLEDGLLDGGFGEKVDRYYATSDMKVLNYGAEKNYNDLVPLAEVYKMNRLNAEQIVEDILNNIRK